MKRNETDAYAMILELITIIKLKSESLVSPNMIQEHETYNIRHTQIHTAHAPWKVIEFTSWLEKSWNLTIDLKNVKSNWKVIEK